jgi:hypothetical protein
MSSADLKLDGVIDAIADRKVPGAVTAGAGVCIALGLGGFAFGMISNPAWAWGAFLVGLVYVLALGQGGVLFGVMLTLTEGRWGRPVKRIGEVFGFFLPVAYILLLVFLIGGQGIYSWNHAPWFGALVDPVDLAPHTEMAWATKEVWLSYPFFLARQCLAVGLLIVLDLVYIRFSLRPDLIKAKARLGSKAPGWWDMVIGGEGSLNAAMETGERMQRVLGTLIALTYAIVFSFLAFDLIMSLAPWWYANMFGAWFFMSSFWLALCAIAVTALLTRDWLGMRHLVTKDVMLDMGKLSLALCMFWAYTGFAMLLPIWYGNMPEETDFLLIRLQLPEWYWLSRTVGVMLFLMPFTVLISRGIKKMKWPFIAILSVIMVGIFLERTMLVMPSIYFEDSFPLDLFFGVSIPVFLGFIGAFVLVVSRVLSQVPPVGVADPFLEDHPWDVHVHSLDAHHGAHH